MKEETKLWLNQAEEHFKDALYLLDRIASEAGLKFSKEWKGDLAEITRHFWKVRYPDFRRYVYTNKKAAEPTIKKTQEIYQWIFKKLNQQ